MLPLQKPRKLIILATLAAITLPLSQVPITFANTPNPEHIAIFQDDSQSVYLGLTISDTNAGVLVRYVEPDSPAATAGIVKQDVITAFDGTQINTVEELRAALSEKSVGDEVVLSVQRDNETLDLTVTLTDYTPSVLIPEARPSAPRGNAGSTRPDWAYQGGVMLFNRDHYQLGVQYQSLTPEIATREALSVENGALVEAVIEGSAAEDAGLQVGDVITAVDGDVIDIERTLSDRLYAYEAEDYVTLTVIREGETLEIGVLIGADHPDKQGNQVQFQFPTRPNNRNHDSHNESRGNSRNHRTPSWSWDSEGFDLDFGFDFLPNFPDFQNLPDADFPEHIPQIFSSRSTLTCTSENGLSFSVVVPSFHDTDLPDEAHSQISELLDGLNITCTTSTSSGQAPTDTPAAPDVPSVPQTSEDAIDNSPNL